MKTLDITNQADLLELSPYVEQYGFVFDEYLENKNDNYHIFKSNINNNYYVIRENKLTIIGHDVLNDKELNCIVKVYGVNVINGYADVYQNLDNSLEIKSMSKTYLGCFKTATLYETDLNFKVISNQRDFERLELLYDASEEYEVSDIFSDNNAEFYGLFNGEEIVGACRISHRYEKSVIITKVITDTKFRGKGYGKQLISEVIKECKKHNLTPYLFYSNPIARSLYKKLNVTELGQWVNIKI